MTRLILFLFVLALATKSLGQQNKSLDSFRTDFSKTLDKNFSEKQLNELFRNDEAFLTPHSDVTRLYNQLQGQQISMFPLYNFKAEKLYTENIDALLHSENPNHRILAYLVIASSYDTSKESILLDKIKTEINKGNLLWAGMALLYLGCNHTTELFDFLVKNENFGDAHMLPMYIRLDKDSLQQTAYNRINNTDIKSKILAAQILAVTLLNVKTEEVLKQAVQNWDIDIKGYAIYSIKELQIGNLLETFKPLLNNTKTRSISLQALANSPTKSDKDFLYELINKQDTVSSDLLDCFFNSKNIENLRYWLSLLYTRKLPAKYIFFVFEQPLISTDSILPDLQRALQKTTDKHVLGELVRALSNRDDDKSIEIIKSLLKHKSSTVRYWTAKTVEDNNSEKFKEKQISNLIKSGLKDGNTPDN